MAEPYILGDVRACHWMARCRLWGGLVPARPVERRTGDRIQFRRTVMGRDKPRRPVHVEYRARRLSDSCGQGKVVRTIESRHPRECGTPPAMSATALARG